MKRILIISVHPDDESFGCGGTILRHIKDGHKLYWMIITNVHDDNGWASDFVQKKQNDINKVSSLYGFEQTFKLDFPTTKLDVIPISGIINKISNVINKIRPEVIYLPNRSDIHTDHQVAFKAITSCTKNFRFPCIKRILLYECLSETEFSPALIENAFIPNVFIDISDFFEKKIQIIRVYNSELMKAPLPRSIDAIESLAKYRGSRIGKKYAESFMLIEEII